MGKMLTKIGPLHVLIIGVVLAAGMGVSMFFFMIKPKAREIASVTKKINSEQMVAAKRKTAEKQLTEAKKTYERAKGELERTIKGKFIELPKDPDRALAVYTRAVMEFRRKLLILAVRTGNVVVRGPTGPELDALAPPQPNEEGLFTYPQGATAGRGTDMGMMGRPMEMGGGPSGPGMTGMEMGGGGAAGNAVDMVIEGNMASIVRFLKELKNFDYPVTILELTLKSTGRRGRTVEARIPMIVYLAMERRPEKEAEAPAPSDMPGMMGPGGGPPVGGTGG